MYKDKPFRIRPVADIKEDLVMAREHYGPQVETLFFPDGNSIIMKTEQLVEIFGFAHTLFPHLSRITLYGSARFINLKSPDDLARLKAAGLSRIHCGMESGDDITLAAIEKGNTADEMIIAGQKVKAAGIELSEYVMIGIGGRERSNQHALASAATLNAINPDFIRLRTFIPLPGSPLYLAYQAGTRQLLTAHEALQETKLLIQSLTVTGWLYSDHYSNYAYVNGKLPEAKSEMLATIEHLLTIPEEDFRHPAEGSL
jgi:radical SAM superfamily enzyme YgiQ (UPF0313 family)